MTDLYYYNLLFKTPLQSRLHLIEIPYSDYSLFLNELTPLFASLIPSPSNLQIHPICVLCLAKRLKFLAYFDRNFQCITTN